MKLSNINDYWPFLEAVKAGKTLQCETHGRWEDSEYMVFDISPNRIRIKPEPKPPTYRAWKPEEVPLGCLLRHNEANECSFTVLTYKSLNEVVFISNRNEMLHLRKETTGSLFSEYSHSIDQGKTWMPCGVLEESK